VLRQADGGEVAASDCSVEGADVEAKLVRDFLR
jgi:hypothetical protein